MFRDHPWFIAGMLAIFVCAMFAANERQKSFEKNSLLQYQEITLYNTTDHNSHPIHLTPYRVITDGTPKDVGEPPLGKADVWRIDLGNGTTIFASTTR